MSVLPELKRERDYLMGARSELARMREHTLSLKPHGEDRVPQREPRRHAAPPCASTERHGYVNSEPGEDQPLLYYYRELGNATS